MQWSKEQIKQYEEYLTYYRGIIEQLTKELKEEDSNFEQDYNSLLAIRRLKNFITSLKIFMK